MIKPMDRSNIEPTDTKQTIEPTSSDRALFPTWFGYLVSSILVSVVYVKLLVWFGIWVEDGWLTQSEPLAEDTYVFGGFLVSLFIMPVALIFISFIHEFWEFRGRIEWFYFVVSGAVAFFCVNCLVCNPFPLETDDNYTDIQSIEISVHREGAYYILCGFLFGGIYWLLSVRPRGRHLVEADRSAAISR